MPTPAQPRFTRRHFLAATGSLAAAAVWSFRALGVVKRHASFVDYPFQLGVASGDPSPDGMALWTRLAPKPLEGGGMPAEDIEVAWQVAEDEQMSRVVRSGTTVASQDWAHAVHVEVEGLLPDRWYWYQFQAGGEVSPKGRTRTTPAADAMPQRVRFAVASCQHFEAGLYTAYEHMLKEDCDLVLHLGDYIYEYAAEEGRVRKHVGGKLDSLDDFRNRHAQYKTDPALQAMHAAAPWLVTPDDHEVENNYAGEIPGNERTPRDKFLAMRASAYQAYYEHMPLRVSSLPKGPDMKLYRRDPFGRLAQFHVLDTRQYRTNQPCGDGEKNCAEMLSPSATLLGDQQEAWLRDGLATSPAKWNVLAQQVIFARVDVLKGGDAAYMVDQWPGYELNRRRLLKFFHERKIANPVVLAGDIHSNWANDLIADFDDLDSQVVATEFAGTSISSSGDGRRVAPRMETLLAENPFIKFNNEERGYLLCEVTPREWRTDFRTIEYVTRPGAPLNTRASFVIEDGRPGLQSV